MSDLIDRRQAIDALHTWFRDGFDEDKWWNSTHVLAAIEGLPSAQQGYKWETCFECPLSHGCPKIKGCTNEQAIEYASQMPNDCPLSAQHDHVADISKKVEGDCISRKEALKICRRYWHPTYNPIMEEIEKLPSAQPEIIRCKDCKHKHVENMVWTCPFGLPGGENFFCGYGAEPYKGE